jgi:hypothetical protein
METIACGRLMLGRILYVMSAFVFLLGCTNRVAISVGSYEATVRSARKAIPIAVQIEELFPETYHFIRQYDGSPNAGPWTSQAYIGGRYFLTVQVDIDIDYKAYRVIPKGEPKILLQEYKEIRPTSGGGYATDAGDLYWLTKAQWEQVYKSRGDFSVVGITVNPNPVPNFDGLVASMHGTNRISLLRE